MYRRYGGPEVVELEEVPKPAPREDEILVKILATTVTAGDWRALTLDLPRGFGLAGRLIFGVARPRHAVLGMEFAGVVEETGPSVTRFRPGDAVFGSTGGKMGCHAQYQTIAQDAHVAHKPVSLSFEEAAALSFGACTALHFLEKAKLRPGERVLVIGASGRPPSRAKRWLNSQQDTPRTIAWPPCQSRALGRCGGVDNRPSVAIGAWRQEVTRPPLLAVHRPIWVVQLGPRVHHGVDDGGSLAHGRPLLLRFDVHGEEGLALDGGHCQSPAITHPDIYDRHRWHAYGRDASPQIP